MIISELIGGLGNQMFQYSAAMALAKRSNVDFRIDNSQFASYPLRPYALADWCISGKIATHNEMLKVASEGDLLLETGSSYEPKMFQKFQSLYMRGYWQSEDYFIDIREQLLSEFIPANELSQSDKNIISYMEDVAPIMMHIRRGDYVSNSHTNSFHGVMPIEYYQNSIEKILNEATDIDGKDVVYFVFSDDPDWCEESFTWLEPKVIVRHNPPKKGFMDIYLMSKCKHFVIANSSFSWWGAWLSQNKSKIVVAPKEWFQSKNVESDHIVPKSWHRI